MRAARSRGTRGVKRPCLRRRVGESVCGHNGEWPIGFFGGRGLGSGKSVARENIFGVKKEAEKGGDTLSQIHAKCEVNMP